MKEKRRIVIPVDPKRCQVEHSGGSFMTFGPREMIRCENPSTYIANERKPGKDGLIGAMSLCDKCAEKMKEIMGKDFAVLSKL